jgi:O-antigen ligase
MRVPLLLTVALVPLIIAPDFLFSFDITPKIVVLLAGTALALLAWRGEWPSAGFARVAALILLAQIAWLAVATALSIQPGLSFSGGGWRRFGFVAQAAVLTCAMMVISDCAGSPERAMAYLRTIALAGLPIGVYGIVQHFGLDPLVSSTSYHSGEGPFTIVRPPSTLGHASYLGTFLVSVVFSSAAIAVTSIKKWWRIVGIASASVSAAAIVVSGTRAALAGVAAGLVLLIFRLPRARMKQVLGSGAAGVALLIAFALSPAGAGTRSRIHWALEEPLAGARPLLWADSVRMASHRLATGFGPDTFTIAFPAYQSAALSRAYPDFQHESPHNVFLDTLVEQGIPGIAFLSLVAGAALWFGLQGSSGSVPLILAAGLAGALVAQQFTVFTAPTALMFYLTAALIAGSLPGERRLVRYRGGVRAALGVVALLMLLFAGRLSLADRALARTRDAITSGNVAAGLAEYEKAQRWQLPGTSTDLYVSREFAALFQRTSDVRVKLQSWTPAFQAAVRASRTAEDRKSAFYNLAIFFATQNDSANVERSLRNAIYLAPNWFKPHWTLSRLLVQQDRMTEAESEARTAVDLSGGKMQEVVETLNDVQIRQARGTGGH